MVRPVSSGGGAGGAGAAWPGPWQATANAPMIAKANARRITRRHRTRHVAAGDDPRQSHAVDARRRYGCKNTSHPFCLVRDGPPRVQASIVARRRSTAQDQGPTTRPKLTFGERGSYSRRSVAWPPLVMRWDLPLLALLAGRGSEMGRRNRAIDARGSFGAYRRRSDARPWSLSETEPFVGCSRCIGSFGPTSRDGRRCMLVVPA